MPYTLNPSSYPPERNLLLRNDGRRASRDVAREAGVDNPTGRSLSASWADFDGDGWPDLYVANDVSDNAMFLQPGQRPLPRHQPLRLGGRLPRGHGPRRRGLGQRRRLRHLHHPLARAGERALRRRDAAHEGHAGGARCASSTRPTSSASARSPSTSSAGARASWTTTTTAGSTSTRSTAARSRRRRTRRGSSPCAASCSGTRASRASSRWAEGGRAVHDARRRPRGELRRLRRRRRPRHRVRRSRRGAAPRAQRGRQPARLGSARAALAPGIRHQAKDGAVRRSTTFATGARVRLTTAGQTQMRLVGGQSSYLSQEPPGEVFFGTGDAATGRTAGGALAERAGAVVRGPAGAGHDPDPRGRRAAGGAEDPAMRRRRRPLLLGLAGVRLGLARLPGLRPRTRPRAPHDATRQRVLDFWNRLNAATEARIAPRLRGGRAPLRGGARARAPARGRLYYLGQCRRELGQPRGGAASPSSGWSRSIPRARAGTSRSARSSPRPTRASPWTSRRPSSTCGARTRSTARRRGPWCGSARSRSWRHARRRPRRWFESALRTNPKSVEAAFLAGYLGWETGRETASLLRRVREAAKVEAPVKGVLSEGDRRDAPARRRPAALEPSRPAAVRRAGRDVLRAHAAAGQADRGRPGAPGMARGTAPAPRVRAARGGRPTLLSRLASAQIRGQVLHRPPPLEHALDVAVELVGPLHVGDPLAAHFDAGKIVAADSHPLAVAEVADPSGSIPMHSTPTRSAAT